MDEPDGGAVDAAFDEAEILTPNRVYQGTSATFLLAALGVVTVPAVVVEPVIAASIVGVAVADLLLRHREGNARRRLPVVFGCGLVHGIAVAA